MGCDRDWLFAHCEALIIPSRVAETSSLVITESQRFLTPIVYPPGGGAQETFTLLKRSGCSLDEFKGQTFLKADKNKWPEAPPVNMTKIFRAELEKILG